jgi:hypothetical protein
MRARRPLLAVAALVQLTTLAAAVVALLSLASCARDAAAICASAGGTYTGSTCSKSNARLRAAEDACESVGGVYLMGDERCAFGEGGP